jgi:hypothetical protein
MLLMVSATARASSARRCQYLGLFHRRLYGMERIVRSHDCPALIYVKVGAAAAHLLTPDEVRRVSANIAKLPELLRAANPSVVAATCKMPVAHPAIFWADPDQTLPTPYCYEHNSPLRKGSFRITVLSSRRSSAATSLRWWRVGALFRSPTTCRDDMSPAALQSSEKQNAGWSR